MAKMMKQDGGNSIDELIVESDIESGKSEDEDLRISFAAGWTIEQIILLNEAVKLYGNMWPQVAQHVGKSEEACRLKAMHKKKPSAFREAVWTEIEIQKLIQSLKLHGSNWGKVSGIIGRSQYACKIKSKRLGIHGKNNIDWDHSSCRRLKEAIEKFGQRWDQVATYIGYNATEKQVWDKAKQLNLIQGGNGDGWNEEDVNKLRAAFEKFSSLGYDGKWKGVSEIVGKS